MLRIYKNIGWVVIFVFLFNVQNTFAVVYNPKVQGWINQTEQELASFGKVAEPSEDSFGCNKSDWTVFVKSFASYDDLLANGQDFLGRNECLREDIWALEDELQKINTVGLQEAKKCNENLESLKYIYQKIRTHIDGLRRYGEDVDLESNEATGCPSCKKAQYVGVGNVGVEYYSSFYTNKGCVLTKSNKRTWQEEWEKLKKAINLYKNVNKMLEENNFSLGFNSSDYAAAQENSQKWWGDTWRKIYSYNGKNFSFTRLKDGEDSVFSFKTVKRLQEMVKEIKAKQPPPKTVAELIETGNINTKELFNSLSFSGEEDEIKDDLSRWQANLKLQYQASRDISGDLENHFIHWDNAIKNIIKNSEEDKSLILDYYEKLKKVAEMHVVNLYGSCK